MILCLTDTSISNILTGHVPTPEYPKFTQQKLLRDYNTTLQKITAKPVLYDNTQGQITWQTSYILESLVKMYRATNQVSYLQKFLAIADKVMAERADIKKKKDWKGRYGKGWLTSSKYTTSLPIILYDRNHHPSFQIIAKYRSYNNLTSIQVKSDQSTFSFLITNPKFKQYSKTYHYLTLQNAYNTLKHNPLIDVQILGNNIPISTEWLTFIPQQTILHGHHTPVILLPYAQFILTVHKNNLAPFKNKAKAYLSRIEESVSEMERLWINKGSYGYYIFEKGSPIWCDGLEEPYNTMSAAGSLFLTLYNITGNEKYKDKTIKIANLMKRGLILTKQDNTYYWKYWYGKAVQGWQRGENVSQNTSYYKGNTAYDDISHGQFTLAFILECYKNRFIFTKTDVQRLCNTFNRRVFLNKEPQPLLATTMAGLGKDGRYDHIFHKFISLGLYDPVIQEKCFLLYKKREKKLADKGNLHLKLITLAEFILVLSQISESPIQ